jgi:3-phenylpropionate/trans-cinnamate dioxygenase ferredoxin subunit
MAVRVDVGALDEFVDGQARRVEVGSQPVAVVRLGDDLYAIGDTCSHANVSLSEGEVDRSERTLECWKHGSAFELATGEPCSLPATRPVDVFDVLVEGGRVYLVSGSG